MKISFRPRILSITERRAIVELYDKTSCKVTAMNLINSMPDCDQIKERRIKRWKKYGMFKIPGRPLSVDFEEEVIAECERTQSKDMPSLNMYPYDVVKECAMKVFNKDYWDESTSSFIKKWHHDKKTCKLQFSNRWVLGLFQRAAKRKISEQDTTETASAVNISHTNVSSSSSQLDIDELIGALINASSSSSSSSSSLSSSRGLQINNTAPCQSVNLDNIATLFSELDDVT